jgi:lipopolysaccharide transport system ATP-binding protein
VVSHSAEAMRALCDRAIWLDHGRVRAMGTTGAVLGEYTSKTVGLPG